MNNKTPRQCEAGKRGSGCKNHPVAKVHLTPGDDGIWLCESHLALCVQAKTNEAKRPASAESEE